MTPPDVDDGQASGLSETDAFKGSRPDGFHLRSKRDGTARMAIGSAADDFGSNAVAARDNAVLAEELGLLIDGATSYAIYMLNPQGRVTIWIGAPSA